MIVLWFDTAVNFFSSNLLHKGVYVILTEVNNLHKSAKCFYNFHHVMVETTNHIWSSGNLFAIA